MKRFYDIYDPIFALVKLATWTAGAGLLFHTTQVVAVYFSYISAILK